MTGIPSFIAEGICTEGFTKDKSEVAQAIVTYEKGDFRNRKVPFFQ